ncbi:hypothetical protein GGR54DRAFT_647682 [Hypoxylon sp. NC1633]|nr:hypothetical protein GGR54DRAFT_647682 [Hypoxylon sp. NC1633]
MAESPAPASAPTQGLIKVYATRDGSAAHWTGPQRLHLHLKTAQGSSKCTCQASITAGGITQAASKALYYQTSSTLVPSTPAERQAHTDTSDGACSPIGSVAHTNRALHYSLIAIDDSVAGAAARDAVVRNRAAAQAEQAFETALHPVNLRFRHRGADVVLLARTRHNEVVWGRVAVLPVVRCPSIRGTARLMLARFAAPVDVGTWVYARRGRELVENKESVKNACLPDNAGTAERLDRFERGPYEREIFEYHRLGAPRWQPYNPVVLVGHVVQVRDREDGEDTHAVTIQTSYEVLTDMFLGQGRLSNPGGD